jgi:glutamate formiminotransferase
MYTVFELIKIEARRYGVNVLGSEIVGIVSAQALIDSAEYYLQLSPLAPDQILENMI